MRPDPNSNRESANRYSGAYDSSFGASPSFESPIDPLTSAGAGSTKLWSGGGKKKKKKRNSVFVELLMVGLLALLLALVMRVFVTQVYAISGHSMQPTLQEGEMVMIHKLSPGILDVDRGDLVIFQSPRHRRKDLIKRVIAVAGDRVRIDENQVVWINGDPIEEPYTVRSLTHRRYEEVVIQPGEIFVLGDNRPQSQDSRNFGPVSLDLIRGKVFLRLWPLRELSVLP